MARPKSTFVTKLDDSIARLPQREAVRYTEKNMKWTASDFNVRRTPHVQVELSCSDKRLFFVSSSSQTHVKNHANAILEFGITSKDTIAVWLPEGAEKV